MPYNEYVKSGKPTFHIFTRKKMTSVEAKTQAITKEHKKTTVTSIKSGVSYIKQQRDPNSIYVLRNDKNEMIRSFSFRKHEWFPINMGGYFGGFKIGNPKGDQFMDPLHPTYNLDRTVVS